MVCQLGELLTRTRDRLGEEVFEAVFRRIVAQCKEKGLVKEHCRAMTGATLMAAAASLNSLVHHDPEKTKQEEEAQQQCRRTIDEKASRRLCERCVPAFSFSHRIGDRIGRVLLDVKLIAVDSAIAEDRLPPAAGSLPRSLTI